MKTAIGLLTEEQIKRYEDNDYEDASFLDVKFVIDGLDMNKNSKRGVFNSFRYAEKNTNY